MAAKVHETGLKVGNSFQINGQAIGGSPNIYSTPTTPDHPIGTLMTCEDGRRYRYCYAVAAITQGKIAAGDISATSLADTDGIFVAASAGATQVQMSSTDVSGATLDGWAGGYLVITDDDGEAYMYRIKSNTATASNVTTVDLYDGLQAAITTDSDGCVVGVLWEDVRPATAATDPWVAGVAVGSLAAADYGWLQTWGPAVVLCDGATTMGSIATLSDGTAGAAQDIGGGGTDAADLKTEPIIGYFLHAGDTTGYTAVYLQIA